MEIKALVSERFSETQKCYGHCDGTTAPKTIADAPLTACYACGAGYVSRVVSYASSPPSGALKSMVSAGLKREVPDEEVRTATRYAWDLGTEVSGGKLGAAFWTQNYGRSKSSDPDRAALFCCAECNGLFLQKLTAGQTLCDACRSKRGQLG